MDLTLTKEQKKVQSRAREFAFKEVLPTAKETDERGEFPIHLVKRMGELGFLAGPIPPKYGGSGMDYLSFALVYEEIGRVCSSVRGFLAVHLGLHSMCILDWGTEEQRMAYLPKLATGEYIGCYALTEPSAGSDVASMETRCHKEGDHWVINGLKHWISNGNVAHTALVFAQSDPALRHKGINAFIVKTDTPGFIREKMVNKELGHRASDHARLRFENMRVHESQMLGPVGSGFKVAMAALDHGRLGVAAGAVGVLQACVDACIKFSRNRVQFGQPIANFQMIQSVISDMVCDLEASRLLVYRAADQKMRGERNTRETSIAKLFATEAAVRAANEAVLLHGSYGYSNENPVERYLRDIKGLQIYEGTSHIQRMIIARSVVKEWELPDALA